jgi:hypothetical protein
MGWRSLLWGLSLVLLLLGQPAWADTSPFPPDAAPLARPLLTLELLQERLRSPVTSEGARLVDLRGLIIDLRLENSGFRDQFYHSLQEQLQRTGPPLGLDFSNSIVEGPLEVSQLGLRAPLFGEALAPLFNPAEQAQLQRDRRRLFQLSRLSQSLLADDQVSRDLQLTVLRGPLKLVQTQFKGPVNFSHTFFLSSLDSRGASFGQPGHWVETRFSQPVTFAGATFRQAVDFHNSIFFAKANFNQAQFQQTAAFHGSDFRGTGNFNRARFRQAVNFSRSQWQGAADFAQTTWQAAAGFGKAQFQQALFLADARFEGAANFREAVFRQPVNLRSATIDDQIDFSDAEFAPKAYLNLPGLQFDPKQARILGNPGQISRVLAVPSLQGNQILLRNLVRNFRQLEQIADANQIEYLGQKLRLRELWQRLVSVNVNQASPERLVEVGFSTAQAQAVVQLRQQHPLRSVSELLGRETVDLATYIRVQNRLTAGEPGSVWNRGVATLQWLGLSALLLFSRYGSSFWLIFGVGLLAIAVFGLLFWGVDRWRWGQPQPVLPSQPEVLGVVAGFAACSLIGVTAILRTAEAPWLTLAFLGGFTLPLPLAILGLLARHGHDPARISYFVEDGSMRQFRLLIGRLPIRPRFPFFRDRYEPILWERRWGWLNYFDLSLNNFFRLGFNDIRLRDEQLPGWVSVLVWYQWGLGILYIALLLWTLSRTIPGLNLFIYF